MKILITKNKTIYGVLLDTYHSVIIDGNYVWSYEGINPLFKRKLKKYEYNKYKNKIGFIYQEIEIPNIKIYNDKLPGHYLCYDWIGYQLSKNNINIPVNFTTDNLKQKAFMSLIKFWYLSILFILIPLIFGFIGYNIGKPNTLQQCGEIFNYNITIE